MIDRQRLALGSGVETVLVDINHVDLNSQSKRPGDLDLLTRKVVSESRVTWATSVPILVSLGLSVLYLGPMYATDRQTSDIQASDKSIV